MEMNMRLKSYSWIAVSLCLGTYLTAEEVTIKAVPNVPVNYVLEINADTIHKVGTTPSDLGKTHLVVDLNANISQKEGAVPELVITPLNAEYRQNSLGFTLAFDSKAIPNGDSPALKMFHNFWGKPLRLPLTTDVDYLNNHSEFFRMLPQENAESYLNFVNAFLGYLANGEHYKTDEHLWHLEFKTAENQLLSDGKVVAITPKNVVIDITLSGQSEKISNEEPSSKFTTNLEATAEKNIDRKNALLRNIKGKGLIKVDSKSLEGSILNGGDLEVSLKFSLTSKAA
jgi:hypothetical protein